VHPERFADQPSQPVAANRVADRPQPHGHAETRFAGFIPDRLHDEQGVRKTIASPARALEFGRGVESLAGPQSVTPGRRSLVSGVR
jgi:hypothetical protein